MAKRTNDKNNKNASRNEEKEKNTGRQAHTSDEEKASHGNHGGANETRDDDKDRDNADKNLGMLGITDEEIDESW